MTPSIAGFRTITLKCTEIYPVVLPSCELAARDVYRRRM
jgi:hypothetical protein